MTVGEKIRDARTTLNVSLTTLSEKLNVSAATLSRIENGKQSLDVKLFLLLAKALRKAPHELLTESGETEQQDELVGRIAGLASTDRIRFWHDLAATRRSSRTQVRNSASRDLTQDVEELLAQVEFLRDEIEEMRGRLRRRR
jgi:transcriptional regulator with XRE-family HTH domain